MKSKEFKSVLLKQCHDNTHSVSRILRNIEFLKKEDISKERYEKCISNIEQSALECQNQLDTLYLKYKELFEVNI